jgi:two-component system, OmpR family, KDP operon response regulator KdpE
MPAIWITTSIDRAQLIKMFDPEQWQIRLYTLDNLLIGNQAQRDPDVMIFDVEADSIPHLLRLICEVKIAPVLAVVPNWALAWDAIEVGADDAVIKPTTAAEVLFHTRRLLHETRIVRIDGLQIDLTARRVKVDRRLVELSPVEFRMLICLARRNGQAVSVDTLLAEVWGCEPDTGGTLNQVKCCIKRLRAKLEPDPHRPLYLLAVKGFGYRLRSQTQWEEHLLHLPQLD